MTKQLRKDTMEELDNEIKGLVEVLGNISADTDDYQVVADNLKRLTDIRESLKDEKRFEKIKPDTLVNGVISLASIMLILKHEKFDIITTKAFTVATRLLGR